MSETKEGEAKKKAPETEVIKGAVILRPQLAQRIMALFDEMPRRFNNIIDPVAAEFGQSPIADVTLNKSEEKPEK